MEQLKPSEKALETMKKANHIYEEFPLSFYGITALVFLIEVVICFWVGLSIQ